MAKGVYIGVSGKARKVKNMYIGVSGKARKVTKGYIGVGGKARPFWTGRGTIEYYGAVTSLPVPRTGGATAAVGGYALFAGGSDYSGSVNSLSVDAYNADLIRSSAASLAEHRTAPAAASGKTHALFMASGSNPLSATIDAYNTSLSRSTPTSLSQARWGASGASVGNYMLCIGGIPGPSSSTEAAATVDAYNASLVRSTPTALLQARHRAACTCVGNYAVIAGGLSSPNGGLITLAEAYNTSLTRSTLTDTPTPYGNRIKGAGTESYAIFLISRSGGSSYGACAYSASLVQNTPAATVSAGVMHVGASVKDYALFVGGSSTSSAVDSVNAYDDDLILHELTGVSNISTVYVEGIGVGNFALISVIISSSSYLNTVYAYVVT
jgi:hypothetical protein